MEENWKMQLLGGSNRGKNEIMYNYYELVEGGRDVFGVPISVMNSEREGDTGGGVAGDGEMVIDKSLFEIEDIEGGCSWCCSGLNASCCCCIANMCCCTKGTWAGTHGEVDDVAGGHATWNRTFVKGNEKKCKIVGRLVRV